MTLTLEQVQAQAAALRGNHHGDNRVLALRHTGPWSGPERTTVAGEELRIIACCSDLQVREALGQLEDAKRGGILLCDLDDAALGEDVLARLVKRHVHHPQWNAILRVLFTAQVMDSRILASRPLVDALIRGASGGEYPPAPGGTLDLHFAWKALLKKILGFEVPEITFTELLRWTTNPSARNALVAMEPMLRSELARWLAPTFGDAPRHLLAALSSELGEDLVALGLLFGLLIAAEGSGVPESHAAAARLEQFFGNESPDATTRKTWYRAADELYVRLAEREIFQAQVIVQNLDRLIERIRLQSHVQLSEHSRSGLEERLAITALAISKAGLSESEEEISTARIALEQVERHRLATSESLRLKRLRMAHRLVLWFRAATIPDSAATLSRLIRYYETEGGFVDWARAMIIESDPNPRVKDALGKIVDIVDKRWTAFQQQFATRLQEWTSQNGDLDGALRIEEVLWKVVAPVARQHPALLIVLDGMNEAVFRELVTDLIRRNWIEVAAPGPGAPRAVVSTVPSITESSRRALFSGQLPVPADGSEKSDFSRSPKLFEQVGGQSKPQLFLKGDLLEAGRIGLSGEVTSAIANQRCRLVGVVVNAVDDSLGAADQTSYTWGLDQVAPLHELMRLATEAGRVVVLTSDHGHLLDEGSQLIRQPLPDTGDRYRQCAGALAEQEMEFRGPRILAAVGTDRIVTLAALRCRYQGKRRGYHGGVCPAEMIVPCVVLRNASVAVPDAWEDLPPYEPDWWSTQVAPVPMAPARPKPSEARRPKTPERQADLFEVTSAVLSQPDWITKLAASPIYVEQTRAAARGAPPVEQLRQFLSALDQRNGRIQRGHLAQQLGMPLIRVDGLIQNYRRLLNVDGYDVLSYDQTSEAIVLNIELLKSQFEL